MTDKMNKWQRFAAAKDAMPSPIKDTKGYGYQYATLAQVRSIVVPALHEQGLDVIQNASGEWHETHRDGAKFSSEVRYVLRTNIVDLETGEAFVSDARELLRDGTDQQRGSSETYQRRYALLTVCGLAPEDDDGASASNRPKSQDEALIKAKSRLWAAVQAYADKTDGDAKKLAEGTKARKDYEETADWYNLVAEEFETA